MNENHCVICWAVIPEDEPLKAACGGNPFSGEISRNKQSRHEGELRRLRLRIGNTARDVGKGS